MASSGFLNSCSCPVDPALLSISTSLAFFFFLRLRHPRTTPPKSNSRPTPPITPPAIIPALLDGDACAEALEVDDMDAETNDPVTELRAEASVDEAAVIIGSSVSPDWKGYPGDAQPSLQSCGVWWLYPIVPDSQQK